MKKVIKIGSRSSLLAIAQTNILINQLRRAYPETEFRLVTMKTTGDVNMKPFSEVTDKFGIKGLFTKELEDALRNETIDIAVHSLKDVPMNATEDLPIVALSKRGDPRDVAVLPKDNCFDGGVIGCSSARRTLQLKNLYNNPKIKPVRGNIVTRIKKLDNGDFSMLILAAAGLIRAGLSERINRYYTVDEIIPAPGQGVLACQGKAGQDYSWLDVITDEKTTRCTIAERTFAKLLGGGCSSPVGAYGEIICNTLTLRGFYADKNGQNIQKRIIQGPVNKPEQLAKKLAELMIKGNKHHD